MSNKAWKAKITGKIGCFWADIPVQDGFWWHESYFDIWDALSPPKNGQNRPTKLLKKSKIAKISQIHYEFIYFHQNLMHVGSFDGELIQTMFSFQ